MWKVIERRNNVKAVTRRLARFILGTNLAVVSLPGAALAQDGNMTEEVVVTANRIATPLASLGSSVTVITAEDLRRQQARHVVDALRTVPGIAVSQTGGTGSTTSIRMRGMESHHTLLLIDGVEVADPSAAQPSYDFGHLLVTDIERIEIVRGPQSTLYGGDAIGGVINVITHKGKGKPHVSASAEGGSFNTQNLRSGLSGSHGKFSYGLNAAFEHTDGFSAASNRNGNSEDDGYRNLTLNGRFELDLTDTFSLAAVTRYMTSHLETDNWSGGRAIDSNDNSDKRERSGKLTARLSLFDGALTNRIGISHSESNRDDFVGKARASYYDGWKDKWDYQGDWRITPANTLLFGAETEKERTRQRTSWGGLSDAVRNNGYFINYQTDPFDSLSLTLGGRIDDHKAFGTHDTYRVTAAYLVDDWSSRLHGSWGTGFRAPSLFELYDPTYGNTALTPEKSRGWDAGIEQSIWDEKVIVDVTWFHNRTQDLIQWDASGYRNIASTKAFGLETTLKADLTHTISVTATHTYTERRNNSTGQVLARRPKHVGSLNFAWEPVDGLTADFGMRASSRLFDSATSNNVGGYALYDVKASYALTSRTTLFGRIKNLFDKQYEEVDTYGTAGLSAYAGVKVQF
jgi:vitamin B12 transporter